VTAQPPAVASPPEAAQEPVRHPLREPDFRALWSANIISNIGVWAQNVGGVWLMTTLTADALPVALMQTATTLPAFLVGLPAGSLADRVDRRRLLLAMQGWMLVMVALLAGVTVAGLITPWLLLTLTFLIGVGATVTAPTWSALLPDVVKRAQVPTAVSMNSGGFNIARAVGPAIGGFVVAASGPAATFVLNACSFMASFVIVFRMRWRAPRTTEPRAPLEPFRHAVLVGIDYVLREPSQRLVLMRSVIWMVCASALWGLLPLVARRELGLDAPGYGFLVTCVGAGAVAGSFLLPRLRRTWPTNQLLLVAVLIFFVLYLTLAWVQILPLVWAMLALGGAAWTGTNQSFQIAVQLSAPPWVRARAIAAYLLTFQGGLALGSAIWGAVADVAGDGAALTGAAIGLTGALIATLRWPLPDQS
jgi:predicted MFS family arabinose efflux permease